MVSRRAGLSASAGHFCYYNTVVFNQNNTQVVAEYSRWRVLVWLCMFRTVRLRY